MNKKPRHERAKILQMLVEGNSLRATSRMAGCSINTVTKLLVEAGQACAWYQDQVFRDLPCKRVQMDEIWSFVYAKQKNVPDEMKGEAGDVWTWTALCADTKLVPSWRIGGRDLETAKDFVNDLSGRLANRVQLTSDGHRAYIEAVEQAFGDDVDFAQLVKIYGNGSTSEVIGTQLKPITGKPESKNISTSFVERQNLTMRMSMRRFTRLTNAFSKKIENHGHAIALHFMYYNFARQHKGLKGSTPAMMAGVTDTLWSIEDIVDMIDNY